MKLVQTELLFEAKQNMLTPEGSESLHNEALTDIANVIIVAISGGAWAAMDEYGKGSLMDMSNPSLQDYINSGLWNSARGSDPTIRSRQRGSYTNIFGEQVESRSNVAGIDLEQKGGKFSPQPPSHAIQTAMRWMKSGRMQNAIRLTIATFPFGSFIVTDKK